MTKSAQHFDLEQRTTQLGIDIVHLCRLPKPDLIVAPIISQLVRSGTSIGANYREANSASSKKDFRNKIAICKKEAEETKHWLQVLASAVTDEIVRERSRLLWKEVHQLTLIFGKILSSLRAA